MHMQLPGLSFYRKLFYRGTRYQALRQATLPNLRRLFIEARTDDEEREVSRKAFYNAVLFMSSVTIFSLIAQRMNAVK
ncbi:hypothetical protein JMJ77_0002962 [Colletotrichum scovillei]|uniref:Uncharacterized protein n=1 Tax=Colletotrichum scovillei TaxID=1209932 RepID=A0A9P7U5J7_9PEZI|nr:hypothetical protein JMJ78_0006171 [Colletotrichum scovillei]KAG7043256.1 hypothetical protein JMJ77_0002962 [Colletotrichum scovillei]KAG7062703.1 hypothetical protein JMJ76_0009546 [Colletotrichum scovillei]